MGAEWSRGDPPAPMLVSLAWVGGRGRRWDPGVPWEGVAVGCAAALPCWGGGGLVLVPPTLGVSVLLPSLPLQCVFDDLSGSVSLSWVGDSTGVSTAGVPPPKWLWFPLQGGQQWPPPVSEGLWGWWDLK